MAAYLPGISVPFATLASVLAFQWLALNVTTSLAQTIDLGSTPAFYEVTKEGQRLFLMGTIHIGRPDLLPLPAPIVDSLASSIALVLETSPSPKAAQEAYASFAMYPKGTNVWQHVSPLLMLRILRTLDKLQIPRGSADQLRPLALANLFEVTDQVAAGYQTRLGTEQILTEMARKLGKPVIGIEEARDAIRLQHQLQDNDQVPFLEQTIADVETGRNRADITRTVNAWKLGDTRALASALENELSRMPPAMQRHERDVVIQRNHIMTKRIEELLASRQRYFVAIGSLHLVGEYGVLTSLVRDGYRVTKL